MEWMKSLESELHLQKREECSTNYVFGECVAQVHDEKKTGDRNHLLSKERVQKHSFQHLQVVEDHLTNNTSDECVERVRVVTRTDDHNQQMCNEKPQGQPL